MGLLTVFSRPLRIPDGVQWALLLGMFGPLGLVFHYKKKLKNESAGDSAREEQSTSKISRVQKRIRKRFIMIWVWTTLLSLAAPIWLPITGVSLGTLGDFLVGVLTAILGSVIFSVRLKKMPISRHSQLGPLVLAADFERLPQEISP
jgi:hypothetical protein